MAAMRKLFAWLGAATLVVLWSISAHAGQNDVLKPYVMLILDTSGSMTDPTGSGPPSCGGIDATDTKLHHAVCAINNIVNSYGDMVFALARFREIPGGTLSGTCPSGCSSNELVNCGNCGNDPCTMCNADADCVAALAGTTCDTTHHYCTGACTASAQCGAGGTCSGTTHLCSNRNNFLCSNNGGNLDCYSAAGPGNPGSCYGSSYCHTEASLFELLSPLVDGNNSVAASFTDGTCNECSMDPTAGNPEIWAASSWTPLAGVFNGSKCYWEGLNEDQEPATGAINTTGADCVPTTQGVQIWPTNQPGYNPIVNDPTNNVFLPKAGQTACNPNPATCNAASTCTGANCCCVSQCRPYIEILLTDGAETCTDDFTNTTNAAAALLTTDVNNKRYRIVTKPIGFGVTPGDTQIEGIAHAGGAPVGPGNAGYYANDEAGLELAISQIIEGSIRSEVCNGLDDDCDGQVDEDFPQVGKPCDNGLLGVCKGTGTYGCKADGTGVQCNITNPGQSPTAEVCNGLDDDCDGKVDEGLTNCTCNPSPEICNGSDDDCNGLVDDGVGPQGCAITNSFGSCPGTAPCAGTPGCLTSPAGCYGACNAQTPAAEICDGKDNNCDGVCDGFNAACSNVNSPGGPASDNLGDPSHNPIPQNVCHPGEKLCPAICGASNSFGACTGEVQGCNPHQNGAIHCDACNGLDDDCDNKIDEDFVPQDCSTNCGVGQTQCVNGQIVCNSTPATTDDTCNGIDDDCDGKIDEDWVCDSSANCTGANCCTCGTGTTCEINKCINGQVTCTTTQQISPEQCNCLDDDCDGHVDENVTCGAGGSCVDCQCAFPCGDGEFPCPMGKKCDKSTSTQGYCVTDPCYGVNCQPDGQGNQQTCVPNPSIPTMAQCVTTCSTVTCPANQVCVGSTGMCAPNDCTTFPQMCAANQNCIVDQNLVGQCVTNLCYGVTCSNGTYCEQGNCVNSCAGVPCPSGQRCRLGQCQPDPCGMPCPSGQVCNDATGSCHDDPCTFRDCPQGNWCNPNDGQCEADPCIGTMCPMTADGGMETCKGGTCYGADQVTGSGGVETHVTVGGGGCSTGGGNTGLVLGLALLLVRRRRHGGAQ
jgi:hypothetical protein